MIVPVKNIVDQVDLTPDDILLPMLECVVNSIISLQKSALPLSLRKIQIQVERDGFPNQRTFENLKKISGFKIIDNGPGFNEENFSSFDTPFSQTNKDFGCKGIGRFTVLAAYKEYIVRSNYFEKGKWFYRHFIFSSEKEIEEVKYEESNNEVHKTITEIRDCIIPFFSEKSALLISEVSEAIMSHCLIYYLNDALPNIEIFDTEDGKVENINKLFENVSKEKEREFFLGDSKFKLYITKTLKEGNRKNNYLYFCANSRAVGNGRNLRNINSIFSYPLMLDGRYYFFDIYLVSEFLNKRAYSARNGFNIPKERSNQLFSNFESITMQDIEEKVSEIIEDEYQSFVKDAKEKNIKKIASYINKKAPSGLSTLKIGVECKAGISEIKGEMTPYL